MKSLCIQFGNVTMIKPYSSWAVGVHIVEQYLKIFYPNLSQWEFETIMLQLEDRPIIKYKDFFADLS